MSWLTDSLDKKVYEKKLASLRKRVEYINRFFSMYEKSFADSGNNISFFENETKKLRNQVNSLIESGMSEDDALSVTMEKAYGLVKLAVKTKFNKTYYDEQLMGAILLNEGYISEMATGEGKTLTAILPTYLNAIMGRGAHVITPNDYLAKRDYEENKPLYEMLGLSVGLVENNKKDKFSLLAEAVAKEELRIIEEINKEKLSPLARRKKIEEARRNIDTKKLLDEIDSSNYKANNSDAYKKDITYGSAQVFAFDYLRDVLDGDITKRITRFGKPNFAVIDEADAVLFDDALSSYRIGGNETDSELGLSKEEKEEMQKNIRYAGQIMDFIIKNGYLATVNNDEDYANEDKFAIYYSPQKKTYTKSTLFNTISFSVIRRDKLLDIVNRNINEVTKYLEKKEYYYQNGKLNVTPIGLYKLIRDHKVNELQTEYDNFLDNYPHRELDNAVRAWVVLKKDEDYILANDKDKPGNKKINIVINGRAQDGRKYSNGLHQAVELKEKYQQIYANTGIRITDSDINDTLSDISVSSFYERYERLSGMTGTSCKDAFKNLYGRETFKVPTHRPRNVTNLGEKVLPTKLDKYKAILNELIVSVRKGQPVLISTTSVDESNALKEFLEGAFKGLAEYNPKFANMKSIPVLNAYLDKLEEEANIIAKAGMMGSITIATEMAGRGTDIKLGGENAPKGEKEKIEALGGLKVICDGHFEYDRVDRQVVGRTGRQGNKGEYCFISDYEDLSRIGIKDNIIEKLKKNEKDLAINASKNSTYMKALKEAQTINEGMNESSIKFEHQFERPSSLCRSYYVKKKEELTKSGDYKKFLEDAMDFCSIQMIGNSSGQVIGEPETVQLSNLHLDKEELRREYEEVFGLSLPDEVFKRCKTANDLVTIMVDLGKDELVGKTINTDSVDKHIKRVWHDFESGVEDIKNQYRASAITNTGEILKNYENTVVKSFYDAYHGEMCEVIKETINKNKKEYKEPINEESVKTGKHM